METKKRIDKRKILLLLPLLIVPLLASGFHLLGGGKGDDLSGQQNVKGGINQSLPDAAFKKDQPKEKIDYYDQADKDSLNRRANSIADVAKNLGFNSQVEQPQTREINTKLEALNREINKPIEPTDYRRGTSAVHNQPSSIKSDVDRLEALMKTMQENKTEDPEMQQLNGLMQNILDIQHPERLQQKYKEQQTVSADSQFRAIPATLAESKKVVQGATVKLILQDTLRIKGVLIPKGHNLYGACKIVNQRLLLDIKQIRLGTSIIPVDLSVYSLDGMLGIDAPEAMLTDAVNSGTDQAVRDIGLMGIDQTLATQVAGAGIDAAKNLMSKKLRKVKVKIQAGRPILLRNNQLKTR
ncbi:conjugative transposon protein TraM [Pedobacter cryoconitis]|uniref:Conjugative transposon TraM protein n=1 Tax=Pedobacter cryoconitis TaxID=188932 RepID=A0A327SKN9_9SPHI|nr:conjugative transposon protein TraM [Pedobacter cryoconitis]RAJ28093.1 conjugative transposon TraM protein [Pedobacter cryoconitis]